MGWRRPGAARHDRAASLPGRHGRAGSGSSRSFSPGRPVYAAAIVGSSCSSPLHAPAPRRAAREGALVQRRRRPPMSRGCDHGLRPRTLVFRDMRARADSARLAHRPSRSRQTALAPSSSDHVDPQPSHGGRAGAAGDPARRARRHALCRADPPAAARLRLGHGKRRTLIVGGMAVLCSAAARRRERADGDGLAAGSALAVVASSSSASVSARPAARFVLLGAGRSRPPRRDHRLGHDRRLVVTAGVAGHFLDPFSPERLAPPRHRRRASSDARGRRRHRGRAAAPHRRRGRRFPSPRRSAGLVGAGRGALRFVFVSMLAYSAQDLILEAFAGLVFETASAIDPALGPAERRRARRHDRACAGRDLVPRAPARRART